MAQPTQYTRQYNFNDFQTTSPADPLPGVQVDNELNSAKTNLDGLNANIAKIQRDDGLLANQSVHKNSLDTDVLALIGLSGYTVAGNWSASNAYTAGTLVNFNDATYLAVTAHTSGTVFATDKDAGKWILLANAAINTSASTVDKFEGTGSQTAFTLTYTYTSNTDVLVFVNGALRNPGDDYTISGNTVTFSTAPSTPSVSGNENVIIWGPNVTVQSAVTAAQTASSNSSGFATAASNSAAAALASQNSAAGSAATATTQAGTATTQAGIATAKAVLTAADAVSTAADVVSTNADAASTAADVVTTNADAATTTADRAQVNTDKGIVAADKAIVAADKALVAADKVDADNSRIAAQAAQAAAEAALDTFDDRFLGAKASDPTLDNDGNALQDGALFYDTANELMKVYDQTNTVWRQLSLTGTNQTNVNAVAGQISPTNNISTVAGAVANIATVAADLSGSNNTGLVGGSIANVNLTGGSIANVNTVAASIADVNNFADTYFVGTSPPSSPTMGDLWFDSNPGVLVMKVYNGSGFVNAGSAVNGIAQSESYIVGTSSGSYAGSTTVFPVTYDTGFVDFYLNGVKLVDGTDFTATNGTSITLTTAAASNDTVDIVAYGTFQLQNTALNDLSDVSVASATSGQFLKYDGTNFVPGTVSTPTLTSLGLDNHDNVTVDSSGNVGIGTQSSIEATLHISDNGSTGPAVFIEGASATEGDIAVVDGENLSVGHWNTTTDTFTQRLRLSSSGNLFANGKTYLGTSSSPAYPNARLQVDGDIYLGDNSSSAFGLYCGGVLSMGGDGDVRIVSDANTSSPSNPVIIAAGSSGSGYDNGGPLSGNLTQGNTDIARFDPQGIVYYKSWNAGTGSNLVMPYGIAQATSAQSVANGRFSLGPNVTRGGMVFTDSTDRFTLPEDGVYIVMFSISGSITISNQSGDGIQLLLRKNGSSIGAGNSYITTLGGSSGDEFAHHDSYIVQANANDYIDAAIANVGGMTGNITYRRLTVAKLY